jgi:hypothetical protein
VPASVDPSELDLSVIDSAPANEVDESAIDGCASGSAEACSVLLGELIVGCDEGYGDICDLLYLVSPVGSEYEYFGATCGLRFAEPYDGWCGDL